MKKIAKQEYTAELTELAVTRFKERLTPGAAANVLGINNQTLVLSCKHSELLRHSVGALSLR